VLIDATSFVLTDEGAAWLRPLVGSWCDPGAAMPLSGCVAKAPGSQVVPILKKLELWLGPTRVLQLPRRAWRQLAVVRLYQDGNWAAAIPLPEAALTDSCEKARLLAALHELNQRQHPRRIHFRGDGSGEFLTWSLIEPQQVKV
jgi:hypothetical protein